MESEHTAKTLQIALGSYDRKELRVEKNYLQEQSPALECTCFQNGGRLLEQLRQGRQFDVVILCSQLEDMSGLEFLMNIRSMDPKPNVVLFDEGRRQNTSAICLESGDGFCYVGHAELKNLLWELYRLPGRQSQRMERKCQELYEGWGIQLPDVNCNYLSCAVGVVYGTSQKLAIRKEILQAVNDISAAAARLDRTVNEVMSLLDFLRTEEDPRLYPLDLCQLLQQVAAQADMVQAQLGVELTLDYGGWTACRVMADRNDAELLCLHLLSNALRACSAGGKVRLMLRRSESFWQLTVMDNGCGLPEAGEDAWLENRRCFLGGAKLGLLLCRECCRRMGWGLRVERAPEKGTQAVVTIPLCTDRITEPTVELHTGGDTAQAQQHQYQLRNMLVRELRTMPERGDPDEL